MAHKNRSDQAHNSNPTWSSMGIHQKGKFLTKNQKKELFKKCGRNCTEKILEHTVQDNYGAKDTHTLPRL